MHLSFERLLVVPLFLLIAAYFIFTVSYITFFSISLLVTFTLFTGLFVKK